MSVEILTPKVVIEPPLDRPKRVYITNVINQDYTAAKEYGEVVPITVGFVNFKDLAKVETLISSAILDSHEDDYLLLMGTSLVCVLATTSWLALHKKVNILTWDRKSTYRHLFIDLNDFEKFILFLKGRKLEVHPKEPPSDLI